MKKKILTVAIAIAALCGIPAMAQTDNTAATQTQQCTKGQKGSCTNNNNRKQAKAAREFQRKDAFDGIQLTDAQKAGLEALNTTGAQKANRNDSTARANRRQARRDYVKGVKNVLTPDQYVVFLENIVVENAQLPGAKPSAQMRKGQAKVHAMKRDRSKNGRTEKMKQARKTQAGATNAAQAN
ncbi:MAG: hypothetical protein JFR41_09425 [Muribaculaceae bacterium]|nr:hypothetical protein [Muribaculaceae bacterium]